MSRATGGTIRRAASIALGMVLLAVVPGAARSAADADGEYAYHAQAHDTLIALGRRLLKQPRQWRALQKLNAIADPTRIPVGTVIVIPRDWLQQQTESAEVTSVAGEVTRAGVGIGPGTTLAEGDRVATSPGGYASIRLADGSVLRLNAASTLQLKGLRRYSGTGARDTQLALDAGTVDAQVAPQGAAGRFQIRTPVAVSAVRGTEFRRGYEQSGGLDRTEVLGGAVAVHGAAADVQVPGGYGTVSDLEHGPRAPVKLLPPPELAQLGSQIDDELVQFGFQAVAGAQSYRAQLASDSAFQSIVAESAVRAPQLQFADVADGHYCLRVRSVDALGLEGADAVHEFDRHKLMVAPQLSDPGAGSTVSGAGVAFRWMPVPGASSYELQLAAEPEYQSPLEDRASLPAREFTLPALAPGTYHWRVAARDARGVRGHWSATQAFRQRQPLARIAQAMLTATSVEFSWSGEPGQRYRIQVARDADFSSIIDDRQVDSPQAIVPRRTAGIYFARVQEIDAAGLAGAFAPARRYFVPWHWWPRHQSPRMPLEWL